MKVLPIDIQVPPECSFSKVIKEQNELIETHNSIFMDSWVGLSMARKTAKLKHTGAGFKHILMGMIICAVTEIQLTQQELPKELKIES